MGKGEVRVVAITKIIVIRNCLSFTCSYIMNMDKTQLSKTEEYITNEEKTLNRKFVSTFNCGSQNPSADMLMTKKLYGKQNRKVAGYHVIQSFAPGEVTPELAHEIGCKLVENSIADSYETVVTTHVNKGHLHNHVLFNSVSFQNGKMYCNRLKDYFKDIRGVSDSLCKQYGLSVVKPSTKGKHYAMWKAENEGQATWRTAISEYVDSAIKASLTMSDFFRSLKDLGFEIKMGKHIAVRPPNKERFVRLKSLGENYTEQAIKERILLQTRKQSLPTTSTYTVKQVRIQCSFFTLKKVTWKGLRGLYFYYLAKLKQARNNRRNKALFLLKDDFRNLDELSRQAQFLFAHKYDRKFQLASHILNAKAEIEVLCAERKKAYRIPNNKETCALTKQIKALRGEIKICEKIQERSEKLYKNRQIIQRELEVANEHTRRSGRTSRKYGDKPNR